MIAIENLSKHFGKSQIFNQLCLKVLPGETLIILGRSGVGKSVLLKHMVGLIKPDEGIVSVEGQQLGYPGGDLLDPAARSIGMLFQGGALFDSMTVAQNAGFYLNEKGDPVTGKTLTKLAIDERVEAVLELVGLQDSKDKRAVELSGGMKRRLAIARVAIVGYKILLYDEPTAGLDPHMTMQINDLIIKTQKHLGTTSVVVTHDLFSALYIGDRIALLRDGAIEHIAKPDDFLQINDADIQFFRSLICQGPRTMRKAHEYS